MQHARVRPAVVGTTGNVLTVFFDTVANLLLLAGVFMVAYAAAGDLIAATVAKVVDPSGHASNAAYHVRALGLTLLGVAAVGAVYFLSGWRRFRSSLGLRMMRVFGVLPQRPRFPAIATGRAYVLRYAVPTVALVAALVGLLVLFG